MNINLVYMSQISDHFPNAPKSQINQLNVFGNYVLDSNVYGV